VQCRRKGNGGGGCEGPTESLRKRPNAVVPAMHGRGGRCVHLRDGRGPPAPSPTSAGTRSWFHSFRPRSPEGGGHKTVAKRPCDAVRRGEPDRGGPFRPAVGEAILNPAAISDCDGTHASTPVTHGPPIGSKRPPGELQPAAASRRAAFNPPSYSGACVLPPAAITTLIHPWAPTRAVTAAIAGADRKPAEIAISTPLSRCRTAKVSAAAKPRGWHSGTQPDWQRTRPSLGETC
jgi:hypothetical protein